MDRIKNLNKRYKFDKLFKYIGIFFISLSFTFVLFLFSNLVKQAYPGIKTTNISLNLAYDTHTNIQELIKSSIKKILPSDMNSDEIYSLISESATDEVMIFFKKNSKLNKKIVTLKLPLTHEADYFLKNIYKDNNLSDSQKYLLKYLKDQKVITIDFNTKFFTNGDSRYPEQAGIIVAIIGSIGTILICIIIAFPIALITAIYLEELAPKNKFISLIEVNINNLASIPSIVFGLFSIVIYLEFFELPRSSMIVGGATLALMSLPTMIFTARSSIRTIPVSFKENVMALGASHMQLIMHHIIPISMPGIITGLLLSLSRAIGETAPLILIGMVAFITKIPESIFDPTTVLPTQIYLWVNSPEIAFQSKTSMAILVLLTILIIFNIISSIIKKEYETKW